VCELHIDAGEVRVKNMNIQIEQSFIEEAVFLTLKNDEHNHHRDLGESFYRELEKIHNEETVLENREEKIRALYKRFFDAVDLSSFFENVIAEFSIFQNTSLSFVIRRAWQKKEETSDLYKNGNVKTAVIALQAIRVLDKEFLAAFLRCELLRLSDMLDEGFSYSPDVVLGGDNEMEDNLVRERFRFLWDAYIDARLKKRAVKTIFTKEKMQKDFSKLFFRWDEEMKKSIWDNLESGRTLTQEGLLQFAKDERILKNLGEGGTRCPLCHFPTHIKSDVNLSASAAIIEEIKNDFPLWNPQEGLCRQCFEMYSSKEKVRI